MCVCVCMHVRTRAHVMWGVTGEGGEREIDLRGFFECIRVYADKGRI